MSAPSSDELSCRLQLRMQVLGGYCASGRGQTLQSCSKQAPHGLNKVVGGVVRPRGQQVLDSGTREDGGLAIPKEFGVRGVNVHLHPSQEYLRLSHSVTRLARYSKQHCDI